MPTVTHHRTLDVRGFADLQHELTGKRPTEATIRSYHSRGLMPSQIEPGRWAKKHPGLVAAPPHSSFS